MVASRRVASQDRGRETQQRVIEGAARVFGGSGYGTASLRGISDASGVSLGAINFHFRSKEQIALAIIQEQHKRASECAAEVIAAHETVLERLLHLTFAMAEQLQTDPVVQAGVELELQVGAFIDPAHRTQDEWHRAFESQFTLGYESGVLTSELDAAALTETYLACFSGVQIFSRVRSGRADLLQSVHNLWLIMLPSLISPDQYSSARAVLDRVFATTAA